MCRRFGMYRLKSNVVKELKDSRHFIVSLRHRSALGECVASFASTMPVAFLEPQFNKFNKNSILFGIEEHMIATHSLEAKGESRVFHPLARGNG